MQTLSNHQTLTSREGGANQPDVSMPASSLQIMASGKKKCNTACAGLLKASSQPSNAGTENMSWHAHTPTCNTSCASRRNSTTNYSKKNSFWANRLKIHSSCATQQFPLLFKYYFIVIAGRVYKCGGGGVVQRTSLEQTFSLKKEKCTESWRVQALASSNLVLRVLPNFLGWMLAKDFT